MAAVKWVAGKCAHRPRFTVKGIKDAVDRRCKSTLRAGLLFGRGAAQSRDR
ncbi:MAG: hypothetical protein JK586_15160 [Nocardiopsis sp. BM-2018]|nr:MAG: hypothetical protein JK586_15160 [Nocardiopsis sp. BM-2018]